MIVHPVLLFHVAAAAICRLQLQDQRCQKALAEDHLARRQDTFVLPGKICFAAASAAIMKATLRTPALGQLQRCTVERGDTTVLFRAVWVPLLLLLLLLQTLAEDIG